MTITERVVALDQLILQGHIQDAFDQFFHPNAVTHTSRDDRSVGKIDKQHRLRHFFEQVAHTNQIRLHSYAVNGSVTFSEYTFSFTTHNGEGREYVEVIRRWWQDGLVVDEKYYIGSETDEPAIGDQSYPVADEQTDDAWLLGIEDEPGTAIAPNTTVDVIVAWDGSLTEVLDTVAQIDGAEVDVIDIVNEADGTAIEMTIIEQPTAIPGVDSVDRFVTIEGIGPKIAELLTSAGIRRFSELAETPVERIREILTEAGPRYRIHDATTWPEQAKLLADSKLDEFKALASQLRGGKRV